MQVRRPDPANRLRYPRTVDELPIELPIRSVILTLGQISLGLIAGALALVLATAPSGSARIVAVIAAILLVAGAAWLIRSLRRQAIIVDGQRLGYRRGPMGKVSGWTDLADVEAATLAKLSTSVRSGHRDVILWTRVGGLDGLSAALLRAQAPALGRESLGRGTSGRLHPFLVPMSALRDHDRITIHSLLSERGVMPG